MGGAQKDFMQSITDLWCTGTLMDREVVSRAFLTVHGGPTPDSQVFLTIFGNSGGPLRDRMAPLLSDSDRMVATHL